MEKTVFVIEAGKRTAKVKKGDNYTKGKFVVSFYYDGYSDHEWNKGAHGISCDVCDTLEQAKKKARYYVKKEVCHE